MSAATRAMRLRSLRNKRSSAGKLSAWRATDHLTRSSPQHDPVVEFRSRAGRNWTAAPVVEQRNGIFERRTVHS